MRVNTLFRKFWKIIENHRRTLWEGFYEGYRLWLISTNCWTCLTNVISINIGLNRGTKWWFLGYYMGSRLWFVSTNCWCLNTKTRFCTPTLGLQIPSSNDSKRSRNRGTNFSYLICQSWYYPWFFSLKLVFAPQLLEQTYANHNKVSSYSAVVLASHVISWFWEKKWKEEDEVYRSV